MTCGIFSIAMLNACSQHLESHRNLGQDVEKTLQKEPNNTHKRRSGIRVLNVQRSQVEGYADNEGLSSSRSSVGYIQQNCLRHGLLCSRMYGCMKTMVEPSLFPTHPVPTLTYKIPYYCTPVSTTRVHIREFHPKGLHTGFRTGQMKTSRASIHR